MNVPVDLREELRALQTLDDDALWVIARSKLPPAEQAHLEVLLARSSAGMLTEAEREELIHLGKETDRLNLRKAQAYVLLYERGFPLPSLDDWDQPS